MACASTQLQAGKAAEAPAKTLEGATEKEPEKLEKDK
jgi:hypothetical protein